MGSSGPPVPVLYDISVLGAGVLDPKARTGVFRVVENVAEALVASGECDVSLCAGGDTFHALYGALRYLETSSALAGVPFRSDSPRARRRAAVLDRLSGGLADPSTSTAGPLRRVSRSLRSRAVARLAARAFPIETDVAGPGVYHSPYHPLPAPNGSRPDRTRFLTVYDLIAIRAPAMYEPHVERHDRAILASIGPADNVTCISHATRDELCEFSGMDPERAFVTPLAASPALFHPVRDEARIAEALARHGIPDAPYLLGVGTLKPGKNLVTTVRTFARLAREGGLGELRLVLVGPRGWDYSAVLDEVRELGELRGRVHFTGFVADADLAPIYAGALAFVFPSLHEGFGLPPLEAMQCGTPVVTSNIPAVAEVVGSAGTLVEPTDVEGYCAALLALARDGDHRREMSRRALERSAEFSWSRCAAETIAAYRTALERAA